MYPGYGFSSYRIFTYKDEKIHELLNVGQSPSIRIYPETHVVYFKDGGHMGYYYNTYYQITGTKAVKVAEEELMDKTVLPKAKYTYYVEGKVVSGEKYVAYTKKLRKGILISDDELNWR